MLISFGTGMSSEGTFLISTCEVEAVGGSSCKDSVWQVEGLYPFNNSSQLFASLEIFSISSDCEGFVRVLPTTGKSFKLSLCRFWAECRLTTCALSSDCLRGYLHTPVVRKWCSTFKADSIERSCNPLLVDRSDM